MIYGATSNLWSFSWQQICQIVVVLWRHISQHMWWQEGQGHIWMLMLLFLITNMNHSLIWTDKLEKYWQLILKEWIYTILLLLCWLSILWILTLKIRSSTLLSKLKVLMSMILLTDSSVLLPSSILLFPLILLLFGQLEKHYLLITMQTIQDSCLFLWTDMYLVQTSHTMLKAIRTRKNWGQFITFSSKMKLWFHGGTNPQQPTTIISSEHSNLILSMRQK